MNGDKLIAIISEAASVGISLAGRQAVRGHEQGHGQGCGCRVQARVMQINSHSIKLYVETSFGLEVTPLLCCIGSFQNKPGCNPNHIPPMVSG